MERVKWVKKDSKKPGLGKSKSAQFGGKISLNTL
jgi:hypothetical protein